MSNVEGSASGESKGGKWNRDYAACLIHKVECLFKIKKRKKMVSSGG